MYGSDDDFSVLIPTQGKSIVEGSGSVLLSEYKPSPEPSPDVDYLQVCDPALTLV